MKGYSPKLPLMLDPTDGFRLNRTLLEVVKQNLKMLVLTSPGERVMMPLFGVGLYNYLFELNTMATRTSVDARIRSQAKRYMPFIKVEKIEFGSEEGLNIDMNVLALVIKYSIPALNAAEVLRISID